VKIGPSGVTIKGSQIVLDGSMVRIASGPGEPADDASSDPRVAPTAPTAPKEAAKADPGQMSQHSATPRQTQPGSFGSTPLQPFHAPAAAASSSPTAAEPERPKSWIEINLKDEEGRAVAGEPFTIVLPDGTTAASGTTDEKGHARVEGFDPGSCRVVFTNLDNEAWRRQ
jgi:type VI secretion system secreted protein VgrG